MPTPAELLPAIAPEIDPASPQAVALLAIADAEVGSHLESPLRDTLVAYKAAHIITLSNRGGAGGAVNALREGELTIAYDNGGMMDDLSLTAYGKRFKELARQHYGVFARTGVMPDAV